MTMNADEAARLQQSVFLFEQQSCWHYNSASRVQEGASFQVRRAYAVTIDMNDYPTNARRFCDYHRDDGGRAAYNFQALNVFLFLIESATLQLKYGNRTGAAAALADAAGGASDSDNEGEEEGEYQTTQEDRLFTEQEAREMQERLGLRVAPHNIRAADAPEQQALVVAPTARAEVHGAGGGIMVLLEEVPVSGDIATWEGRFTDFTNMMRKRRPACYTLHLLIGFDFDLNRSLQFMLSKNVLNLQNGCEYLVPLSDTQRASVLNAVERDRAADEDAGQVGQKRQKSQPRQAKRRTHMDLRTWEQYMLVDPHLMHRICDAYTRTDVASRYASANPGMGTQINDDNPCNANRWFSVASAIARRPMNCASEQSLVTYMAGHRGVLTAAVSPYCSPDPQRGFDDVVWRVPRGTAGRFYRCADPDNVRTAVFVQKFLPCAQCSGQILSDVWGGMFPLDSKSTSAAVWVSAHNNERIVELGGSIDPIFIGDVRVSEERIEALHELVVGTSAEEAAIELRLMRRQLIDDETRLDEMEEQVRRAVLRGIEFGEVDNSRSLLGTASDASSSGTTSIGVSLDGGFGGSISSMILDNDNARTSGINASSDDGVADMDTAPATDTAVVADYTMVEHVREQQQAMRFRIDDLAMVCNDALRIQIDEGYERSRAQRLQRFRWQSAMREVRGRLGNSQVDPNERIMEFDTSILTHERAPEQLSELMHAQQRVGRRANVYNDMERSNAPVLEQLRDYVSHRGADISPVARRALYLCYQQSVLRQYCNSARTDTADVPTAAKVILRTIEAKRLYARERRFMFQKIDPTMSVVSNLCATQLLQYEVVYGCARPYITWMAYWFSMSATRYLFALKMNLIIAGNAAISKTYSVMVIFELRCNTGVNCKEQTTIVTVRMTECATSVDDGGESNFTTRVLNEARMTTFVNKDEAGTGSADMKQLLDQCLSQVSAPFFDRETNRSAMTLRISEQLVNYIMCINWSMAALHAAMLSRFYTMNLADIGSSKAGINQAQQRMMEVRRMDRGKREEINLFHQMMHATQFEIDMFVKIRVINELTLWMVGFVLGHISRTLIDQGMRPLPPRTIQMTETGARTLAIQEVVVREYCMPNGMYFANDVTPHNLVSLEPFLYVGIGHVVTAVGKLVNEWFVKGEGSVRAAIREWMRQQKARKGSINPLFKRIYNCPPQPPPTGNAYAPATPQTRANEVGDRVRTILGDARYASGSSSNALLALDEFRDESSNSNMATDSSRMLSATTNFVSSNSLPAYVPSHDYNGGGGNHNGYRSGLREDWYDFNWVRFERTNRSVEPFMFLAKELMPLIESTPAIAKISVDIVCMALTRLSEETLESPNYVKYDRHDLMNEPVADDSMMSSATILRVEEKSIFVNYHWLCSIEEPSVQIVENSIRALCAKRHQPYQRLTWTPSDEHPNTFNVIEIGNHDCDDERYETMVTPNASYLPESYMNILYPNQREQREHQWKRIENTRIDMSYDRYAARLHCEKYYGHELPTTERDMARTLYTAEQVLGELDDHSRYHCHEFAERDFVQFDDKRDVDMPEECFRVHNPDANVPGAPRTVVYHDILHADEPDARKRARAFKLNAEFTVSECCEDRVDMAGRSIGLEMYSYPDDFRKRAAAAPRSARDNVCDVSETVGRCASARDETERAYIKELEEQGMRARARMRNRTIRRM